jgi:hypothetical protein
VAKLPIKEKAIDPIIHFAIGAAKKAGNGIILSPS